MRVKKKKPLYPALLVLMMLVLPGCGNGTLSDGKKMPADWMDISTENDKEFTMIRVKDDYLEIRSGEANAFVYTEPGTSYYLVDGEWVDATDKELLTKYESEPLPPGNELTCLGEPTLVALFK